MRYWRLAPLVLSVLAFATPTKAEPSGNLTVQVYRWYNDEVGYAYPPDRLTEPPVCEGSITSADEIAFDWGGGVVAGCDYERVVVHVSGTITIPEDVNLIVTHDDGGVLILDGVEVISAWWDTGCAWDSVPVAAGTYTLDYWFYENGGWACATLMYSPAGAEWWANAALVPAAWYGPSTTTTTTSTTTSTSTTTTGPETTTTSVPESTTLPVEETTTWPESTTTTTATIAPTTVPTEPAPATTPTPATPPDTQPPDTQPEPSTPPETSPDETSPAETQPRESEPAPEASEAPQDSTPTDSSEPATTTPAEDSSLPEPTPTFAPPADATTSNTTADEVLSNALDAVLNGDPEALIANLDVSVLSDEQVAELVTALNEAGDEVKAAFEAEVNVYSGRFDAYVPKGSVISVGQRRTFIAATTMTATVMPSPSERKKRKS